MASNLDMYFKSLSKIPLLTKSQEIELAKKIELGDAEARKLMVKSNLRLAISIAKKYAKYGSDIEDVIQESNIGLLKAVDKFDWRKGYKFSTYACWWIRQAATKRLTADSSLVQIPTHVVAETRKILQAIQEYKDTLHSEPSIEEIADVLNLEVKIVKNALDSIKAKNALSIDTPISDDSSRSIGDMIPDNQNIHPDELIDRRNLTNLILSSFSKLTKREELVLRMRFGLPDLVENDNNVYDIKE